MKMNVNILRQVNASVQGVLLKTQYLQSYRDRYVKLVKQSLNLDRYLVHGKRTLQINRYIQSVSNDLNLTTIGTQAQGHTPNADWEDIHM